MQGILVQLLASLHQEEWSDPELDAGRLTVMNSDRARDSADASDDDDGDDCSVSERYISED